MTMVKVVASGSQKLGEPTMQLVKTSARGLRGADFKQFVKQAGWKLADAVRHIKLHPGEELVHNIALGASEFYGANRNGDSFQVATCRQHHPTFVKHAHAFRNHNNKDPQQSYGVVKHSDFNEDMKRIELLLAYNGTKEAAQHNGGLVADDELQLLHAGKEFPTSMACKVAYDVCAACGNKAKNRSEYCLGEDEGGLCKRGGVKNRMCFVHDDGFMNHVHNPHPAFFDLSKVFRGADRISWANGLVKAASGLLVGGAELAELQGIELPAYLFAADELWPTRLEKLAAELAQLENNYADGQPRVWDLALSSHWDYPANWLQHGGTLKQALAALTMHKIALPVQRWMELVHGEYCPTMLTSSLPGVHGRMLADGSITAASTLLPAMITAIPGTTMKWAQQLAVDHSLDSVYLEKRNQRAALYGLVRLEPRSSPLLKTAGSAETLARGYALYQLGFLQALFGRDPEFDLTKTLTIRKNYL